MKDNKILEKFLFIEKKHKVCINLHKTKNNRLKKNNNKKSKMIFLIKFKMTCKIKFLKIYNYLKQNHKINLILHFKIKFKLDKEYNHLNFKKIRNILNIKKNISSYDIVKF